jgi:hypothetical protein
MQVVFRMRRDVLKISTNIMKRVSYLAYNDFKQALAQISGNTSLK